MLSLTAVRATLRASSRTAAPIQQLRSIHISHPVREEAEKSDANATEDAEAGAPPPTVAKRRRNFQKWIENEGTQYATPVYNTTNYLGATPFPMNPLFRPTPPLSDATKEDIYKLHINDTSVWTPRQLGTKYNISIKRVEAILRMKHLEKEMAEEGIAPQVHLTKGMEQLMGVVYKRSQAVVEPLTDILPLVGSPKFEAVDEDKEFTAADAAKVLNRRPLAKIKEQLLAKERASPFKLVDSVGGVAKRLEVPTKALSKNTSETSARFKFTFTDLAKESKVGTLIRDKDGTLQQVQAKKA